MLTLTTSSKKLLAAIPPFFPIAILSALVLAGCARPYVFQESGVSQQPALYQDHAVMEDGYRLPIISFDAARDMVQAVVIAVHGLNDYSNAFQATGQYLAQYNITLIAYDQRGFGRSAGRGYWHGTETLKRDLQTMIGLVHSRYPQVPLYVLGESMGGAVALAATANRHAPAEIEGIILLAPAVWATSTMPFYQRLALQFMAHTFPWMRFTGESLDVKPSDNIDMLRSLGRDPRVIKETRVDVLFGLSRLMDQALASAPDLRHDTLILYGKNDQIIPPKPLCRLIKTLPDQDLHSMNLKLYTNGYHMLTRDLQGEKVQHDISQWILSRTGATLPQTTYTNGDDLASFCRPWLSAQH